MFINKVFVFGNMTKNPELKSTQSGIQVCSFSVATNRKWKDKSGQQQEEAQFHNVVAFGRTAELVAQYMTKGSGIFIEGRLQTRSWEAKDGSKRYTTEIVAENIQFGPKSPNSAQNAPKTEPLQPGYMKDTQNNGEIGEISSDDLPF